MTRHPARMRVLRLVRKYGPISSYAISRLTRRAHSTSRMHLRMLALLGCVERTGEGDDSFWRTCA